MLFNTILEEMKTNLSALAGVVTCRIGIEANLSPKDYPIIRLVPQQFRKSNNVNTRLCDLFIYFGLPMTEGKDGLETILSSLMTMEQQIINTTREGSDYRSTYMKTIMSDGSVEHYKLICVVLEVEFKN